MLRLLALAAFLILPACETVKGVGRDITSAAETLDRF